MKKHFHFLLCATFLSLLFPSLYSQDVDEPIAVYLTWVNDPTSTMVIQWITGDSHYNPTIYYRKIENDTWMKSQGIHYPMPDEHPYLVHRNELVGLLPNTRYLFRIGDTGKIHAFRTMPKILDGEIKFIAGGDMYHDSIKNLITMHKIAASTNPSFALIGGDIAYSSSKWYQPDKYHRWIDFLKAWSNYMVTPDGNLIPLIPAIGNHDVTGRYLQPPSKARFFYTLFAMPGIQGYNVLDFSDYMTLFILDSGHTHPISGEQSIWLENALKKRFDYPLKFSLYHVPAYPSVRKFHGKDNAEVREKWVPIFEKYQLTTAFEHHDHAYKRSELILNDQINPDGVLYLGDGAWGVKKTRKPKSVEKNWYLAKTDSTPHFILVSVSKDQTRFSAINNEGSVFDHFSINSKVKPCVPAP